MAQILLLQDLLQQLAVAVAGHYLMYQMYKDKGKQEVQVVVLMVIE